MFIDPMTLFIIGEILVVYIIINVFLFYKSRLYKVLLALLKEMRFERLRREQVKKANLAAERASNAGLLSNSDRVKKTDDATDALMLSDQLNERIAELTDKNTVIRDLTNSVERNQSAQWLRLRILELEQELLSGNITDQRWEELASEAITRLHLQQEEEEQTTENRKETAEGERYTGQLETDLSEAENKLADALLRVQKLEGELEEMKSISTPAENPMEAPSNGLHEEEIYRLKCDNFDLTESINKLKLELQKQDPSSGNDAYLQLLEAQIANMEQYIKSADIQTGLLEKELSGAQSIINDLNNKLSHLGKNSSTVDLSPLSQLNDQHVAKTEMVTAFRGTLERLKEGEETSIISSEMEDHITQLENIIRESQQCISILESELQLSSQAIAQLEKDLANRKADAIDNKLSQLNHAQEGQKTGISSLKTMISDFRAGGDSDKLLTAQEQEIEKLERFLNESDTLISQLETEIDQLQAQLDQAQPSGRVETRPDSDENMEEMEVLLQQFIIDIQGLLRMINRLEDENNVLRANTGEPTISNSTKASAETSTDELNQE